MVAAIALSFAAVACGGGGNGDAEQPDGSAGAGIVTPDFSKSEEAQPAPTTAPSGTAASAPPAAASPTSSPQVPAEAQEKVSFDDPVGDATARAGDDEPPPWSDLAGGSLERQANAYRLVVRLGGTAPQTSPRPMTMNVACFFDVDLDGTVDRELWVNVGPGGWGPVWYDDSGNAARGADANTNVVVDGDEVRLLFPDTMLRAPERLRFSLASEYGTLAEIGTDLARRDDAPDGDRYLSFP